jgi:hypothetical protein
MCFDETYNVEVFRNMAGKFFQYYYDIARTNSIIASKQNSIDIARIIVPFLNCPHASGSTSYITLALNNIQKLVFSLDHDQLRYLFGNLPKTGSSMANNKTVKAIRILIKTILNINEYDEITQIDVARETRDKDTLLKLAQSEHQDTKQIAARRLRRIERLEALS